MWKKIQGKAIKETITRKSDKQVFLWGGRGIIFLGVFLPFSFFLSGSVHAGNLEADVRIRVNVIAEACNIRPGDENIQLDFGTVIKKYLYINTRTHSKPFAIHLIDCDPSIAKTVTVKLTGQESTALPGLLAFNPSSMARGAALGLEHADGSAFPINGSDTYTVPTGDLTLNYQAYVQGEPDAIQNNSIVGGNFSATAIYSLDYE